MSKKRRTGLQIRFNPESEGDISDFLSTLKKSEVHITAISAFRMYMRSIGFYDRCRIESSNSPDAMKTDKIYSAIRENTQADIEHEGVVDEETFRAFEGMFNSENELSG